MDGDGDYVLNHSVRILQIGFAGGKFVLYFPFADLFYILFVTFMRFYCQKYNDLDEIIS